MAYNWVPMADVRKLPNFWNKDEADCKCVYPDQYIDPVARICTRNDPFMTLPALKEEGE